jgi:hypothetical protein
MSSADREAAFANATRYPGSQFLSIARIKFKILFAFRPIRGDQ